MTDIMKLADDYADKADEAGWQQDQGWKEDVIVATREAKILARAALQSAIEALQAEVERLKLKAAATDEAISWATPHVESIITERDQLRATLTKFEKQVTPAQVEAAWRAGWAACRDAEYVGQEAEDEAWGMSETCANADWDNAAPKALEPLTDDQIADLHRDAYTTGKAFTTIEVYTYFARVIEAAHGIGGK